MGTKVNCFYVSSTTLHISINVASKYHSISTMNIYYGISSTLDSQQLSQIIYLPLMFLIRFVVVVVVVALEG